MIMMLVEIISTSSRSNFCPGDPPLFLGHGVRGAGCNRSPRGRDDIDRGGLRSLASFAHPDAELTLTPIRCIPVSTRPKGDVHPKMSAVRGAMPNTSKQWPTPTTSAMAEMVEWRGPDFDPETVDEVVIQNQLTRFALRSRRKPKAAASL